MPQHLPTPPSSQYHSLFETVISAMVVLVAICFFAFMLVRTGPGRLGSYELILRMTNADGLAPGTDVRLAGMKIGSVSNLSLDLKDYAARVRIRIRDDLNLPLDSMAQISYPPMGDVYLSITPGHNARILPPGGELDLIHAPHPNRAGV